MFRGRYRWLMRILLILLIAGLGYVWAQRERARHHFVVENHSGHPIATLDIKIGEQSKSYRDVADGSTVVPSFEVNTGEKYNIRADLGTAGVDHVFGTLGEERHLVILPKGQTIFVDRARK